MAEVASTIAFSAIQNNDKIGLILFSDKIEKVIPSTQRASTGLTYDSRYSCILARGQGTDFEQSLEFLNRISKAQGGGFLSLGFFARYFGAAFGFCAQKWRIGHEAFKSNGRAS